MTNLSKYAEIKNMDFFFTNFNREFKNYFFLYMY